MANNGKELFRHLYGNILQCCLAMDGIFFAYIARQEKDVYVCNVFQAFSYDEVSENKHMNAVTDWQGNSSNGANISLLFLPSISAPLPSLTQVTIPMFASNCVCLCVCVHVLGI